MLTEEQVNAYLAPLDANQAESVRVLRSLILECEPSLDEQVCEDKWYGGLLVYKAPNGYPIYALGPRSGGKSTLHLMPYYASSALQAKHGEALKRFASGKSCFMFNNAHDLPLDRIRDICTGGAESFANAIATREQASGRKKLAS